VEEFVALTPEEQETLLKRLTHHALCKMRRLTWRGAYVTKGGAVPGGYEPYDFALDAIEKLLDGTRPWNKEKYATLEKALRSTIDSDINHLVESIDNAHGKRLGSPATKGDTALAYVVHSMEPIPIKVVIDRDWQEQYHKAAMKVLNGDAFLGKLFECLEGEITEPHEIATMLDISVDDVNNGKKRLRRTLAKLDGRFTHPNKKVLS
jgi:hypothetical protein